MLFDCVEVEPLENAALQRWFDPVGPHKCSRLCYDRFLEMLKADSEVHTKEVGRLKLETKESTGENLAEVEEVS